MANRDTYLTLGGFAEGFYKEKGSKFFSLAYPVDHEDAIKEILAALKKKYHDARHLCYAYVLGHDGEKFRANDDGEPGHSAGDPILGQIRSHGLTNVLIVVVRYFGGTKLGVGGLVNAYKRAAADAIANNSIEEIAILSELTLHFAYEQLSHVMKLVKDFDAQIRWQNMSANCTMKIGVKQSQVHALKMTLDYTVEFEE